MKVQGVLLLALCAASAGALSPVTRVVQLLEGLAKTIDKELDAEKNLYEKYVCWAKTLVSTKEATNEKAQSRSDSLEAYVADLESGRIELTTERVDLEKELAQLTQDIETAEALREKEHSDYLAAKDEMEKAITALQGAVDVLDEATEGHAANLITMRVKVNEGFKERMADAAALVHAVDLSKTYLTHSDARFLQRLLTGNVAVPERDHKRLNQKADFKKKYKARSGKIQKVLSKLLSTFQANLEEAETKETDSQKVHDTLMESKGSQKTAAENALGKMGVEGAARGLSLTEAKDEVAELKTQMENDRRFIEQTKASMEEKKGEWADRKGLRLGEIEAINKAIAVLRDDDARDLFKKSHSSQGYDFLQVSVTSTSREAMVRRGAADTIRAAGRTASDKRLAVLAARVSVAAGKDHFAKVIEAIDTMITKLKEEEDADLATKEQCEKDRADDTRKAILTSREIDELSDTVTKLRSEIAEIEATIKEKEEEIKQIEEEVERAKEQRSEETANWKVTDKEDTDAAGLIAKAKTVLQAFYEENGFALVQQHFQREPPVMVAGEAPPPPPSTWEAPYEGKQGENQGIVAILDMIKADIEKDQKKAKDEEDTAQKEHETFVEESEAQVTALEDAITTLTKTKTDKEEEKSTTKGDRSTQKGDLDVVMGKIADAAPNCDYYATNYHVRRNNRKIEIEGLQNGKAILQGATFE